MTEFEQGRGATGPRPSRVLVKAAAGRKRPAKVAHSWMAVMHKSMDGRTAGYACFTTAS